MDKTDKEAEEEKLDRDTGLIAMGVVMGVLGGFVANYWVRWSNNVLLENHLLGALFIALVTFSFFVLIFIFLHLNKIRKSRNVFVALFPTLKSGWKWYVFAVGPLCLLIFIALYNNPTSVIS